MSEGQKPQGVTLRRKPLKLDPRIVPDGRWPGMFRLRLPDGSLSDMVNLTTPSRHFVTKAKHEVATQLAEPGDSNFSLGHRETKFWFRLAVRS
jgi:hypothetical protein